MPKNKAGYKYNWYRVKSEFMSHIDKSLTKILEEHNIPPCQNTHNHTNGWIDERNEMMKRVLDRTMERTENRLVEEWKQEIDVLKAIRFKVAERLKEAIDNNQKVDPGDLLQYMTTMEKNVKTHKLIRGEPEKIEEHRSIHLAVVQLIGEIESGQDKEHRRPILENTEPL